MQAKLYHGTPAVNCGEGITQLCELVGGWFKRQIQSGDEQIHIPVSDAYLKKIESFPRNRVSS